MVRVRTPWGPARMDEGRVLRLAAPDGRAALWALGAWHGRRFPQVLVLGLARAEGKLSLLEEGGRACRNDSLVAALRIQGRARGKLSRASRAARRLWDAYAAGVRAGMDGYGPASAENLAAWDLLFAALPEAERLFSRPSPFRASNAAALAGRRVRGGGSLLWLDPHVPTGPRGDLFLHPLFVRSPEYTACGLARAGSPFVLAGTGPFLAWTLCSSWAETVEERKGPGGRGWWKPPGERGWLRPGFLSCPLPSLWAYGAARSRSAPALIRRTVSSPPLAHTHVTAADGRGRIAWCLGVAPGGRGGALALGGREGVLVQCNASPGWVRPGRAKKVVPLEGDASWRHLRALEELGRLLDSRGRIGPAELETLARDTRDGAALWVAREALSGEAQAQVRSVLKRFRGNAAARSRAASMAYLLEGALLEEEPSLAGALHLAGALDRALGLLPRKAAARAARRAFRRWESLGRPFWGSLHQGLPGSPDTLLAFGGVPWGPKSFGAEEGSLLPMVIRLTEKGARARLLDPRDPRGALTVRVGE